MACTLFALLFCVLHGTANAGEVFAQRPEERLVGIEQEIEALETKQQAANAVANLARGCGQPENSLTIKNMQEEWQSCEQKIKELEAKRNAIVYVGKFKLTGYCPCSRCSSGWGTQTASGHTATEGVTIAADPRVLPIGTRVYIENVGERVVQDVGGAIKGNRIDVYVSAHQSAYQLEINQNAKLWVLK